MVNNDNITIECRNCGPGLKREYFVESLLEVLSENAKLSQVVVDRDLRDDVLHDPGVETRSPPCKPQLA